MKLIVNPHKIEIEKTPVNEREINITKCEFEFAEEITQEYVKEAYFTFNGTSYKVIIQNDECDIPNEVLTEKGQVELGVVCFLVENETEIKRYNPSPAYFNTWIGSLKNNPKNSEPVTPSDKEQIEQALNNGLNDIAEAVENVERLDIDAEKVDKTTTITITKQDGTQTTTEINDGVDGQDGVSLEYKWSGTNLGIKREDEQNYEFVNLKGDTGAPGQIKFTIVNELPLVGDQDTIYLVPYEDAETGNNYKEYIYVNGAWEELGSIPVEVDLSDYYTKTEVNNLIPTSLNQLTDDSTHRLVSDTEKATWSAKYDKPSGGIPSTDLTSAVQTSLGKADSAIQIGDLTDYVKNTDYATSSKGGVIKVVSGAGIYVAGSGAFYSNKISYSDYSNFSENGFISKGTLENVITGKQLTDKTYVDGLVGDIATALDTIQGEVI